MKYLLGKPQDFFDFVDSIKEDDKVGIITHTDLDGLASAFFVEKILESKGIIPKRIDFTGIDIDSFQKLYDGFMEDKITKVIITDLNAENFDWEGFSKFRENMNVFLIDHHPVIERDWDETNIIKTQAADCSALAAYILAKQYIDLREYDWLLTSAMIADWAFNSEENLNLLIEKCEDINSKEDIDSSKSMQLAHAIGSALTYYNGEFYKVYELLKEKDFEELENVASIVEEKMQIAQKKYLSDAKYYPEKKLYYYFLEDTDLVSPSNLLTRVSQKDFSSAYIIVYASRKNPDIVKVSSRCQSGEINVNALLRKGIEGLKEATAGGHVKASGAAFLRKDLEKFKKQLLG
jgi:single-stranded DNA-specific DHH superfamily exonuclease